MKGQHILNIIFAWFLPMPLWLKITITIMCGIAIILEIVLSILKEITKNKCKKLFYGA